LFRTTGFASVIRVATPRLVSISRFAPGVNKATRETMGDQQGVLLLRKQLKELSRNPIEGFSAGLVDDTNVFEWQITVMGPPDTI
jgi:hypothetical protein|tara:strand:- start:1101 stop:1355 length:255 start_codon:yes stop_codon:yes gene_type:complete